MFRLTNTDLPDEQTPETSPAPTLRLWTDGVSELAPIFGYSRFAGILNPIYDTGSFALDRPNYKGQYYRIETGFAIASLTSVTASGGVFVPVEEPIELRPGYASIDTQAINLYSLEQVTDDEALSVVLTVETVFPIGVNGVHSIDISDWGDFTATTITSGGLTWTLAVDENNPQEGEFVQDADSIDLYAYASFSPPLLAATEVLGTLSASSGSAIGVWMSFDLSTSGLDYIDGVDYLGLTFAPAASPAAPSLREFFYWQGWLTLLVDDAIGSGIQTQEEVRSGEGSIGELSYDSY